MDVNAYRELRLLTDISSNVSVTQRRLSTRLGLALGLTNLLIRRLVKKGYVKIVNLQRNRLQYLLTPTGLAEKARLTYEYLEYSLYFYRQIRTFLSRVLAGIQQSEGKRILLYGTDEVAEIAFLVIQQSGFRVVAIVDGQVGGPRRVFLNQPVRALAELPTLAFDRVVVATLGNRHQIIQQLHEHGVSDEKIVMISDEHAAELRGATSDHSAHEEPVTIPTEAHAA